MSIKDLFYRNQKYKVVTSSSLDQIGNKVESHKYVQEYHKEKSRYVPTVDFGNPAEFSFYGSAEEYYRNTIQRIYQEYPYDGSLSEKLEFENSSSYLDKWFLQNEYPRTNGFISVGQNWGNSDLGSVTSFTGDANDYGTDTYKVSPKPQFVHFKGGPNGPAIRPYDDKTIEIADYKNPLHKSNIYNTGRDLESNLQIDGVSGSTVEFWFKAGSSQANSDKFLGPSPNVALFDLWNSGSLTADQDNPATYGRFLIEMRRDAADLSSFKGDKLFYVTIMSGNSGVDRAPIGASTLTSDYNLADWNHYAFTFKNNAASGLDLKLYINGNLQETVVTGSSIGEITEGPHLANIGAYMYAPNTASVSGWTAGGRNQEGIGCISGSFDEFRFWKERRDSERIAQYYNSQIGGGTNSDPANNHLGVYFKFNEGITTSGSVDKNVLDYSGRISNGTIVNYDSALSMRFTGSAMVQAGSASAEFKDPIIYSYHPEVQTTEEEFILKGIEHDFRNSNMLYNSLPDWIVNEDASSGNIKYLFQILSSYFDQLHAMISDIPRLKDVRYVSGSNQRPLPFAKELLESTGFFAPEIFPNASVLNNFLDRDENGIVYEKNLHDIKNFIYENIYHNLTYINKTKGTSKSIRNLIRCFGVDDELYKINMYSDGLTYKPETGYTNTTSKFNYADFSHRERNSAVVFQSTASSNSNSSGFLNHSDDSTSGFDSDIGMSFEADVFFPHPPIVSDPNFITSSFGHLSSSLFGVHTAKSTASDLAWATNDYGNFQVYAVRDESTVPNSKNAYFQLRSTSGGILESNEITSSLFYDVYDNRKWNFAVVVKPSEYPNSTYVSGTTDDYVVEFHGYSFLADLVTDSFVLTASVTGQAGRRFVSSKKRFYVGAHRQDFTGAAIDQSDVRLSNCKIWTIPIGTQEIIAHGRDATNYGVSNPEKNAFLNENKSTFSGFVPRIKTLALHWDFSNVSGSTDDGEFLVEDLSSGSSDSRFGDFSAILEKQHTGQGMFFKPNDTDSVSKEYVTISKTQFLENLNNENFVQVLDKDDEFFGVPRARPVRYFFTIEKSMYQAINDQMIDMFASLSGLQSYASLIGQPVEKYRADYKDLKFMRGLFFDKVNNEPDLEKFLNFYKWFDESINAMILNLIPASSNFAGVLNVVESHILERNKYQHKFPTIDSKLPDITGSIEGINRHKYNWKFGHAPTASPTFAKAVDCIDTTNVGSDTKFTILIPTHAGGESLSTAVTIFLDADQASNPVEGANEIGIGIISLTDASIATKIIKAINGDTDNNIDYASSGVGQAGVKGITATQGSSDTKITLTIDQAGIEGNLTNAITTTVAGDHDIVDLRSFSGASPGGKSPSNQKKNTIWWKQRAERNTYAPNDFGTSDSGVENTRGFIHSATLQAFNRHLDRPFDFNVLEFRKEGPKNYRAFFPHLQYDSTNVIEIKESSIPDSIAFSGSDDHKELYPPKKFKAALYGKLNSGGGDTHEGEEVYNHLFPFNMYSSSLDTKVSREFKEGLIITDQHRDTYHTFENEPLQGPFTNTHVGGNQYRHISLNKGAKENLVERNRDGRLDDDEIRPEGWRVKFDDLGTEKRIRLVSPDFDGADKPRATYLRDEAAKRPVNIRNIHYTTASQDLGNFTKNYEVVMTSGRNINNQYFKENLGVSVTGSKSTLVSGTFDFTLPDRSKDSFKTKTVIAERFSAPGEPATLSRGFLDVESESFSAYNNINYRNFTVRNRLRTLLSASSAEYGLADDLSSLANDLENKDTFVRAIFHNVNKNSVKRIELKELRPDGNGDILGGTPASSTGDDDHYQTGTVSDNFYIQHQIPRSVMQYSWITASAETGPFGFEKPNPIYASRASDDITFISASSFGSVFNGGTRKYGVDAAAANLYSNHDFYPDNFIGMAAHVVNLFSTDSDVLETNLNDDQIYDQPNSFNRIRKQFDGEKTPLNAINLHRNGPYGYPSWKQWRTGEHPLARYHKRNNILKHLVLKYQEEKFRAPALADVELREIIQVTEAPVNSAYKPMIHSFNLSVGGGMDVKSTYGAKKSTPLSQLVTKQGEKVPFLQAAGLNPEGPTPPVFELLGELPHDEMAKLYITKEVPDAVNPLAMMDPEDASYVPPAESVRYSEVVFPPERRSYLDTSRGRASYSQTRSQFSSGLFGQQRIFWKNAQIDRLRDDTDTTLNSLGFKIDKSHTKGFPAQRTTSGDYDVSGGIFVVDRSNPSPRSTKVSASGGSAALSIWPLDTDGEGSAVYALVANDDENSSTHAPAYYIGRGAGELSNSDDWTLYYKDYSPTASISYAFVQQLHFSGAYQGNDTSPSFGATNKSVKLPKYQTPDLIGSKPWYDSYEDYAEDIRYMAKDHTVIPEFAISEHMDLYLKKGSFVEKRNDLFELKGASGSNLDVPLGTTSPITSSANFPTSISEGFFKSFIDSGDMKYLSELRNQHSEANMEPEVFTVSFDSIMKMLPYQGFYPALRTTQLASLLSQSYGAHLGPVNANHWPAKPDGLRTTGTRTAAFIQPFFAPGIMFNTIKSGIAVDWPVFRGDYDFDTAQDGSSFRGSGFISGSTNNPTFTVGAAGDTSVITTHGGPNARLPFEALLEPEAYLETSASNGDSGKYIHLGPQWNQYGYQNGNFFTGSRGDGTAGGVLEPASISFTFTGTPTNGNKIGIESILGTKITGTIDTSISAQTGTINATGPHFAGTIPMNGVSTTTDVAQRVFDFVKAVTDTANVGSLTAFQDDNVVTLYSSNGDQANDLDVTDGGGTIIDNVTISNSNKFAGGQKANVSFFDWSGDNEPKYTIAMHNFLAEIPNFFLEKGDFNTNLTTFASAPQAEWEGFKGGKKYYMDIVLQKSDSFAMFEGPASFQTPGARVNFTGSARGIHYGPAMRWTNESSGHNESDEYFRNLADPAFAPYTPPYFYGTSIARLEFDPLRVVSDQGTDADTFDLDDIIQGTEVYYINKSEKHPEFAQLSIAGRSTSLHESSANTPASASFMHLSSSVNMFGRSTKNSLTFAPSVNDIFNNLQPTSVQDGEDPVWVISTKFECPILNFSGNAGPAKGTDLGGLTEFEKACFDSKGMWYGSGTLAGGGITLSLKESYPDAYNQPDSDKLSLIQACKFATGRKSKKKLGQLKSRKTISEAIVAIPYDVKTGKPFKISRQSYDIISNNILTGKSDALPEQFDGLDKEIKETSIGNMIRKMAKFVIPPHLDFRNPEVFNPLDPNSSVQEPFVMYIMEFNHVLDQADLQNIWQNVMPKIAKSAKKSNRSISHQLNVDWEFFSEGLPTEEFRFKIFKVKQRAHNNYFALTPSSDSKKTKLLTDSFGFDFDSETHVPYSYNWPYDFFSLVETGKMETSVDFKEKLFIGPQADGKRQYYKFRDIQADSSDPSADET